MKLLALLALLPLVACSSAAPPERALYLMRPPVAAFAGPVEAPAPVGLRSVRVAAYLEDPALLLETVPGQVRSARHHAWAEPLDEGMLRLLRSELSVALGADVEADASRTNLWRHVVDVRVDQFHGSSTGDAVLVAGWTVTGAGGAADATRHRLSARQRLAEPGYAALAEAQIELVRRLAAAIAESLPPGAP